MEWCPLGAWLAFDEDQTNQAPFSSNDECDLWLAVGHPKAEAIRDGIAAALSPAPFGIQVSADPLAPKRKSSASGFDWPRGAFISDHHRSDGGAALFLRLLIFFSPMTCIIHIDKGGPDETQKKNSIEYRNGSRFKQKKKPGTKNERTLQRMQIYSFFFNATTLPPPAYRSLLHVFIFHVDWVPPQVVSKKKHSEEIANQSDYRSVKYRIKKEKSLKKRCHRTKKIHRRCDKNNSLEREIPQR